MTNRNSHNTLDHFDERASSWHQLYERPQFQDRLSLFVHGIKDNVAPQSRVLDYGCGTGRIALELAACGFQVDGVDCSSRMIEKARCEAEFRRLSSAKFEIIDPTVWHPRKKYNAIVCSSVLEYVPDDKTLISLFAETLVPKGLLLISVPYAYSITGIMEDVLHSRCHPIITHKRDVQFAQRRYTRDALTKQLELVGFERPNWISFEFPFLNQIGVRLSRIPVLGVMMLAITHRHSDQSV